jgi:hypothetical protein
MAERDTSVAAPVVELPVRTTKPVTATVRKLNRARLRGEGPVQKLKAEAGDVLEAARANARIEPKQMADTMGISHSLVLRGLKSVDHLSFHRLWELSDDFWAELLIAIAKKRGVALVRVSIDLRGRDGR